LSKVEKIDQAHHEWLRWFEELWKTSRDRYGSDFYRRIGKMGDERTRELYAEVLKEFGEKGDRPRRPTLDEYMGEEAGK